MRLSFTEAMPDAPTKFRFIVLEEESWTCKLMIATRKVYVAVVMEWNVVAQGDSPDDALESAERLLMGYAAIAHEHQAEGTPFVPPRPAPEDYQRVATSGDRYVNPNREWAEVCGSDSWPIVRRGVIDMAQSGMRLVTKP